jgi:hypothetical protein
MTVWEFMDKNPFLTIALVFLALATFEFVVETASKRR